MVSFVQYEGNCFSSFVIQGNYKSLFHVGIQFGKKYCVNLGVLTPFSVILL